MCATGAHAVARYAKLPVLFQSRACIPHAPYTLQMSRLPGFLATQKLRCATFSGSLLCIGRVRQDGRCVMAGLSLVLRQPIAGLGDVGGDLRLQLGQAGEFGFVAQFVQKADVQALSV